MEDSVSRSKRESVLKRANSFSATAKYWMKEEGGRAFHKH